MSDMTENDKLKQRILELESEKELERAAALREAADRYGKKFGESEETYEVVDFILALIPQADAHEPEKGGVE